MCVFVCLCVIVVCVFSVLFEDKLVCVCGLFGVDFIDVYVLLKFVGFCECVSYGVEKMCDGVLWLVSVCVVMGVLVMLDVMLCDDVVGVEWVREIFLRVVNDDVWMMM